MRRKKEKKKKKKESSFENTTKNPKTNDHNFHHSPNNNKINNNNNNNNNTSSSSSMSAIVRNPGEKTFFRLLHEELRKAQRFFDQAQKEFQIREERLQEGMSIMKQPHSFMVTEKWSCLTKSVYNLYKDLLLLETFAIMAYCSFSKILKKHDKVTGYDTRGAFMSKVVNKTNFASYPVIFDMIGRTESLYEEVSKNLADNTSGGLGEDERLFINMIHRLNSQILDKEGASPPTDKWKERKQPPSSLSGTKKFPDQLTSHTECKVTDSLRNLVRENDALSRASSKCLSDDQEDNNQRCSSSLSSHTTTTKSSQQQQQLPSSNQPYTTTTTSQSSNPQKNDSSKKYLVVNTPCSSSNSTSSGSSSSQRQSEKKSKRHKTC